MEQTEVKDTDQHQAECIVPETFEGWATLHLMYTIDWRKWSLLSEGEQEQNLGQLQHFLENNETLDNEQGHSAIFAQLGHKGDLMLLHFRKTLEQLKQVENEFALLNIADFLEKKHSYVSYVELGMYAFTHKLHAELLDKGLKPNSDEWQSAWTENMKEQEARVHNRLFTNIPDEKYLCFYPMNKLRNDVNNWYTVPFEKRQSMMLEHGMIGRKYAGKVNQIISGSIGFDDWEWGVDLFANDPIVFKKLVYEMRYDEASALYGEFGPFYIAYRLRPNDLEGFFVS
ncbi:heme-dependent peroxidase [bacterium]|nr:heme-dependent peroxidase [bacterium]